MQKRGKGGVGEGGGERDCVSYILIGKGYKTFSLAYFTYKFEMSSFLDNFSYWKKLDSTFCRKYFVLYIVQK